MAQVEDPGTLEPEWRSLLLQAESPTVFQHPAWHRIWWEVFGDRVERACYAARNESGDLVGVAPMLRGGDRSLVFSGDPEVCDYMDVIAPRGLEKPVLAALLCQWRAEEISSLQLWGLREGSPTLEVLAGGEAAPEVHAEEESVAPRVPLPEHWEDYFGRLSKKDRHELRRKLRRLESAGMTVAFSAFADTKAIDGNLDEFFRLHTMSRSDKAEFMTERMREFFRRIAHEFAELGVARLFSLTLDRRPVAALLAFEGQDLAIWNSGFDPTYSHLSVGLLSKLMAVRWAQERGHPYADFLRGREPYKYDLGGQDLRIYRCRVQIT